MGCSCGKLTAKGKYTGTRAPKRKEPKGVKNLPPLKASSIVKRPADFGRLPDRLTEEDEPEQSDKEVVNQSAAAAPVAAKSPSAVLVSRSFEMNDFLGYGDRF